jgi:signal peptidase I
MTDNKIENSTEDTTKDSIELSNSQQDVKTLSKKEKWIKEGKSIFWIVLLVMAFRSVFFEPFRIPSGSMIPTLLIGDFILVNKLAYGLKVPFSDMYSDPIYLYKRDMPKRGDIIVFKFPKDPDVNYIKRVVGVPGDTIELIDKVVYVNGKAVESKEIDSKPFMDDMDVKFLGYKLKFEQVKDGDHIHTIMKDVEQTYKTDYAKRVVPAGQFFVLGDNRDFSYDSRFWGFVPFENIKGEALFIWFNMIIPFLDDNTPFRMRPWRIGTILH